MITALAKHARMVRLPNNQLSVLTKLYKVSSKLEQDCGRKPGSDDHISVLKRGGFVPGTK